MAVVEKPWGRELIYASTELYIGKIIEINEGARLSLQLHEQKDETIYVLDGTLRLVIGDSPDTLTSRDLSEGVSFRVQTGQVHRYQAPYGSVRVLEVSTPHPNDVVRLEDDYGREGTSNA
ncbi:MAG: cupin [Chloroflexi bacterium]|nr:cupin [Chloroflexota bacterium]HCU72434.1 cupin [Chloroflexota bacterium]